MVIGQISESPVEQVKSNVIENSKKKSINMNFKHKKI